ncbi:MAG: hypothetical protein MSC31_14730 [Solirubrobacteraceae bacterium MAG38_C4-C5]|nr:hypothetical protein [Candidatus Siliceabacter maunaloa]
MTTATRPRPATPAARQAPRPPRTTRPTALSGAAAVAPAAPARVAMPARLRLAHAARGLPDSPFIDRLLAGRMWVAVVAIALIGIVFMQVSLLRLNAGIGESLERQANLERQNAALRADVSGLSAGPRIEEVAGGLGMLMAPAGDVRYLDVRGVDRTLLGDRAAHVMAAPSAQALATAQEGVSPETRAAAAASADAPPGTTPATGASVEGPVTAPARAAATSAAQAPVDPAPVDQVPADPALVDPVAAPVDPAAGAATP